MKHGDTPDILLVIPPPFFTKMPHIGVAYLASFLKQRGYQVAVEDLSVKLHNNAPDSMKKFWHIDCVNSFFQSEIAESIHSNFRKEITEFVDRFLGTETRVIGFSVNIISIYLANKIAQEIKAKDRQRLVIFGGPGTFYSHPRDQIKPNFNDIYVIGEGEFTLGNLLDDYYKGKKINNFPGILLAKDLERFQPSLPADIKNLDELSYPTFSEFTLSEYNQGNDYKPLPLLLSRGCIGRCSYCIDHLMWPHYRFRSAANIIGEIEYHLRNNNARAFEMIDLTCNGNLEQLSELCDLIFNSGFEFSWVSYAIIRKGMDSQLLANMKRAGCHTIIYGVENGSDKVLKKMGKTYTAEEASGVIRDTHKAGICANINIIVGFPGETEEDFMQTVDFIRRNKDYIDEITNVSACTLFPSADIGCNKEKYGINWQEGTDPMLFCDSNGLDRQGRNDRVTRLIKIIDELGLSKSIVNKPSLNPEVKAILENEKKEV